MRSNRVIRTGTNISSSNWVTGQYESRGNKFVTFRVNALDDTGSLMAEYDYTRIFEYSTGQKGTAQNASVAPAVAEDADAEFVPRVTYDGPPPDLDSVSVGDELPEFVIGETQMTIGATPFEDEENESSPQNIHNDPEFAGKGLYTGIIDGGVTTISYIVQMLERWFPSEGFTMKAALSSKG